MKSACVVSIKPLSTALVIDVDIEDEEEEDRDQKRHTTHARTHTHTHTYTHTHTHTHTHIYAYVSSFSVRTLYCACGYYAARRRGSSRRIQGTLQNVQRWLSAEERPHSFVHRFKMRFFAVGCSRLQISVTFNKRKFVRLRLVHTCFVHFDALFLLACSHSRHHQGAHFHYFVWM